MKHKKKKTIKELYKQQRTRIKRAIKRLEREGFIVDENILPKEVKRPTRASINRLSKITPEYIRSKSAYYDYLENETLKWEGNKKYIRKLIKERKNVPNVPVDGVGAIYRTWRHYILGFPERISYIVLSTADRLIANDEYGVRGLVFSILAQPQNLPELLAKYRYPSDLGAIIYAEHLINYMPGLTDRQKAEMMEEFEAYEDYIDE